MRFQFLTVASEKCLSSGKLGRVISHKLTDAAEILTAPIIKVIGDESSPKKVTFTNHDIRR
jgi:hypothetical protein